MLRIAGLASPSQEQIWVAEMFHESGSEYHLFRSFSIRGLEDDQILMQALKQTVAATEILRTRLVLRDNKLQQVVEDDADVVIKHARYRQSDEAFRAPFTLDYGPLWRFVIEQRVGELIFTFVAHHCILDDRSAALVMGLFGRNCERLRHGMAPESPTTEVSYAAYSESMRKEQADRVGSVTDFWEEFASGFWPAEEPEPIPEFLAHPATFNAEPSGQSVTTLAAERLSQVARDWRTTPTILLLVAFIESIGVITGNPHVITCVTTDGRPRREHRGVIGPCFSVLPIAMMAEVGSETFARKVHGSLAAAISHDPGSFGEVTQIARRATGIANLARPGFIFNQQSVAGQNLSIDGLEVTALPPGPRECSFLLSASVWADRDEVRIRFETSWRSTQALNLLAVQELYANVVTNMLSNTH